VLVVAPAAVAAAIATSPATAAAASIATRSAAPSSPKAGSLGTSFVDGQGSPFEALPIQRSDRALSVFTLDEFDKAKTARLAADFVSNHHGRRHAKARIRDELAQRTVSGAMRQIPYIKLSHFILQ